MVKPVPKIYHGMKPDVDRVRVEEDERITALIKHYGIQDLFTFVSYSVDDPGWRSANARVHAISRE